MRSTLLALLVLVTIGVQAQTPMDTYITRLMSRMTLEEKIGQLNLVTSDMAVTGPMVRPGYKEDILKGRVGGIFNAYTPAFVRTLQDMAVKQTRMHIPLIFGYDIIHGHKTIFPINLGLSCSWDTALIRQTAATAAAEASADGVNWTFSPMVDIARDPRWGRIAEGAGEDPFYGAQVARAMVEGYQGEGLSSGHAVMACVKHFALYGAAEAGRDYNTVDMSHVRMYNEYLPPYHAAVEAGAGSIMTSFNEINGIPSTVNQWLLTDLLRKQWGFKGFVVTDYNAINETVAHGMGDTTQVGGQALKAGVDMDMMSENFVTRLPILLKEGQVTEAEIDETCRKVLEAKYKLGLFSDPYRYVSEERAATEIMSPEKLELARKAGEASMVLLKNEGGILPLKSGSTIALVGPLADDHRDMIGNWSAAGDASKAVTVLEGLQKAIGSSGRILYAKGANLVDKGSMFDLLNANGAGLTIDPRDSAELIAEAVSDAQQADVVVAVLGESEGMTGEAASRTDISLLPQQRRLLEALVATGKPVVLVLMNGRPLTLPWEAAHVGAILESWFPGTEAGNALADVLLGKYDPSGKLTTTFPVNVGQIPIYYNHKNTGRPFDGNNLTKYASRYIDAPNDPLFPFGFGLSYTHFTYSDLKVEHDGAVIRVGVTLTNDGNYDGAEVAQLYIRDMVGQITRPVKELKGFRKVYLRKGEQQRVEFTLTRDDLSYYNGGLDRVCNPGDYRVFVGGNSRDVLEAGFRLQ